MRRKKHPLLGKIGQAKSTSGGRNWMQLKHLFSTTKTSQDEPPVELVRHYTLYTVVGDLTCWAIKQTLVKF